MLRARLDVLAGGGAAQHQRAPTAAPPSPPPFNVNTISQGVSTADFYMNVPTALVRFLESDSHTKTIAKPQLRGAEGTKLTLNLGDDVPVLQTVFGAAAQGGFATIPQSSYTYRLGRRERRGDAARDLRRRDHSELVIENSTLGGSLDVGGQSAPTFGTRKVTTKLRLREGESNLLAGLLRDATAATCAGFPGLLRLPVFKQFLSDNDHDRTDRYRDAPDAAHRPHARAHGRGSVADLYRHAAEPRAGRSAAAHRAIARRRRRRRRRSGPA